MNQQKVDITIISEKGKMLSQNAIPSRSHLGKLSTTLREISWPHNLAIFSRCKTTEDREFYLRLAEAYRQQWFQNIKRNCPIKNYYKKNYMSYLK